MALLVKTEDALKAAGLPDDSIKYLKKVDNAVVKAVEECKVKQLPKLIFELSEALFQAEKSLPRRCPTTSIVQDMLEEQFEHNMTLMLDAMKGCLCEGKPEKKAASKP